ncbi:DUF4276 family protein [Pseudomonas syringae]|nr:DUF4276 family protein [Pseudomonas syringae]
MMSVALATEDELSEAVGLKLLAEHDVFRGAQPLLLRKNGSGYLRSRILSWKQMANHQIVLVLTDLDDCHCPVALLSDWLGPEREIPENMLLRVAVRETESWVLADHEGLRKLVGAKGKLPPAPDELPDPKQQLLKIARSAPRRVREDLVGMRGSAMVQGLGYNNVLVDWIASEWDPARASSRSPSLERTRRRLQELALRALDQQ